MPHPNEIANGGLASQFVGTAIATTNVPSLLLAANSRRVAFTLSPGANVRLAYPTQTGSVSFPVASGAVFEERDYKGDVRVFQDAGGAAPVWVTDVVLP